MMLVKAIQTGGRFVAYWTWNRLVAGAGQFNTKPPGVSARVEKLISGSGVTGAVTWAHRRNCSEPVTGTQYVVAVFVAVIVGETIVQTASVRLVFSST